MPQIPNLGTQSINTNAVDLGQGPSIARSDMVAQAWGQLGQTVANIGEQLMTKRKQADTSSFINTNKNNLSRMLSEKEDELTQKYSGDPTGYSAEINEFINEIGTQALENAPNEDAKNIWEQEFSSLSNQIGMNAQAKENRNKAIYQAGLIDEDVYKNRQMLSKKPNPALAADLFNNSLKSIKDGIGLYYTEVEANEKARKYGADYAGTLLEGFENSKQFGAGLRFLDGRDPAGKGLLEYTDPKQMQAYKERFQRLGEQEVELSKRVLNTQIDAVSTALMQGMKVPEDVFNSVASQANLLKPDERALVMDNLNNAKQYNSVLQELKTMPVSKIRDMAAFNIPQKEGDIFNLNARQNLAGMYQKAASDILEKKLTDGAAFVIGNDSEIENLSLQSLDVSNTAAMKDYSIRVTEKQKLDGIANIKVLDKTMAKTYGAMISSPNPEAADAAFQGIKAGFGSQTGNVVSELIANKAITETHAMALYLSDDVARKQSLANIAKKAEIDTAFNKIGKKSELSDLFNSSEVSEIKKAIKVNDPTNQRLWINNGLDSLLELEYKNLRANGASDNEAKQSALSKVVSGNFAVANSKNSSVVLTKDYIPSKSKIQDYMTETLNPVNLRNFKLSVPKSYSEQMSILGRQGEGLSQYYQDVSKNGAWLTNSAQNGVRLAKKTANGGYAQVLDDKGKPIEVSFDDMVKSNTKRISRREGF